MRRPTPAAGACGFTLIEVVIALAVVSLIGAAIAAAMGTATSAVTRAEAVADAAAGERVLGHYVRRQVSVAVPRFTRRRNRRALWFEGRGDTLSWVAELPVHAAGGGERALRLGIIDGALTLEYRPITSEVESLADVWLDPLLDDGRIVVLEDAERLRLTYRAGNDDGVGWRTSWRDRDVMPGFVRIVVEVNGVERGPVDIRLLAAGRRRVRAVAPPPTQAPLLPSPSQDSDDAPPLSVRPPR